MKISLLVLVSFFMIGCDRDSGYVIDGKPIRENTICMNGVLYYSFHRRMAPVFKTDGNIILCH